jgi:hypothetical protein
MEATTRRVSVSCGGAARGVEAAVQVSAWHGGHDLAARRTGYDVAVLVAKICGWVWWLQWKVEAAGLTQI